MVHTYTRVNPTEEKAAWKRIPHSRCKCLRMSSRCSCYSKYCSSFSIGGISFAILGKLSIEDVDGILSACVLESTPGREWVFLGHLVTSTLIYAACKA